MKKKSIKNYYIDLSFFPEDQGSIIEIINEDIKRELYFGVKELKKLNRLYSDGYRDFTVSTYDDVVYGLFPKNHLLKDYGLWLIIDSGKINLVLYDMNSNNIIGNASSTLREQFSKREEFERESDFFKKALFIEVNDLFDSITKNTNIKSSDVGHIVKAGDPIFSYLIYDIFPSEEIKQELVKRFPVKSAVDLGMSMFTNSCFIDLGSERNSNSLFMFIAKIYAKKTDNDFILILNDWIACFNNAENTLTFISGVVENQLQEKIIDYMKKNMIRLPIEIEIVKSVDIRNYIKAYYLSQDDFSDTMKTKNFDIGVLGIW